MGRLVLWCIGALHHQMAKMDFLQHLVSSFLQFGGRGDEGPGSPDGPPEPPRGFGPGSPPSACPSLKSLRSSNLDSPLITTPATSFGASPPGMFTQGEEYWLRSVLQALPSPSSLDDPDIRLPDLRGGVWGAVSMEDTEGGIRDAPHISVS